MSDPYGFALVEEHTEPTTLPDLVRALHGAFVPIASDLRVPPFDLTVVVTADLTASVVARGIPGFDPERVGGQVRGKTLPILPSYSKTVIVIDAGSAPQGDEFHEAEWVSLVSHEYGHLFLSRLRAEAGTEPNPLARYPTPFEVGRILACAAADEYRCDLLSDAVLRAVARYTVNGGEPQPVTLATLRGPLYTGELALAHDEIVHPGWPNLIDRYRTGRIDLADMYETLVRQVDGITKLVAHADAVATSAGLPPVLTGGEDKRGIGLYLRDAWMPIRAILDETPMIPCLDEFAEIDTAVYTAGAGIADMLHKLGVRGEVTANNELYLHVTEPAR
jgi:hypothetical protein